MSTRVSNSMPILRAPSPMAERRTRPRTWCGHTTP
jgi:hypothetical protein